MVSDTFVSYISKFLSIFTYGSGDDNGIDIASQPINHTKDSLMIKPNDDELLPIIDDNNSNREAIVSSFISQFESEINTKEFFCGSIPSSIIDLCCLYYKFSNTIHLNVNDYFLNIGNNKLVQLEKDSKTNHNQYFIESFSKFTKNNNYLFQNIVYIGYDSFNDEYEIDYCLQLVSLPSDIKNITIDYALSSKQINLEWKNIVTMKVGDVVGAPAILHKKDYIQSIRDNHISLSCDINIILKNGKSA